MEGLDYKSAVKHLEKDRALRPYLESITLQERSPAADVYSGLISSIVSQQLSVKAAATIHGRFIALFTEGYPAPAKLLALDDTELRGVGLSSQKTKYVKNVASFFTDQHLFDQDWGDLSDEEIIILLTEIKGVGKWTVQMILMFVLKRPDVLPVLDLSIQQGIAKVYGLTSTKKELYADMERIAKKWRPYRTVACLYLWQV